MITQPVPRRNLLLGAAGAAALAACGSRRATSTANNAAVTLPTYTPVTGGPTPDLAGSPGTLLDGFLTYPANPVTMASGAPGDGSTVTVFVQTYSPVAPGLGSNRYYQQLNRALGVDLRISVVPATDYNDKFAALVAGDLPDLLHVRTSVVDVPALLAAKCQDLTPYLSGDAVKEYPFLANVPTAAWRAAAVHNGAIYGVPVPRALLGQTFFRRDDLIAARGLNPDPASFADFSQLCRGLTDARHNRWALSNADSAFFFILQMLGAPNATASPIGGWRDAGGTLTSSYELEQTKQALADTAKMCKDGMVHPDSFGSATQDLTTNYKQWFNAGSAALHGDNYPAWWQFYVQNIAGPTFKIGAIVPPNYDSGSTAVTWQGNPAFSYTALKKAGDARIRQLLKLCNWLAAPFGSTEYLLKTYGVEGVDWQRNSAGDAALTKTGQSEVPGLGTGYVAAAPYVLYYAGQAQATKNIYAFQQKFVPKSVADPTLGLDSATNNRVGSSLYSKMVDARHAIMRGQQPVSSWDDAVKQWRSAGGDQIRKELATQLQKR
jgi:putative aldouronate transport system substrate-binding protein